MKQQESTSDKDDLLSNDGNEEKYGLHETPLAGNAGGDERYTNNNGRKTDDQTNSSNVKGDGSKNMTIEVHGWMHKQGKRVIKGPIHKSWKRRYFALEKSKIFYFQNHLECRQYFTTRNADLVIGAIELKDALKLKISARLDLPHRGFELHTKRRVWVLCPESEQEYRMWFNSLEHAIITEGSGNVLEKELPNVRKYEMKGITTYRFFYFLFIIAGLVEMFGLVFWFIIGFQPCDGGRKNETCFDILTTTLDDLSCTPNAFNGVWEPPQWMYELANVENVKCFHKAPVAQWVSYFLLVIAEVLTFILAAFYYLGMWKPVRRGAQYLDQFRPKLPQEQWPKVDVFICHYAEPAEQTIETLTCAINLQYPPHLLHIWILDDGYCKAKWDKGNVIPHIELNKHVIETSGDLRQEVAQFMYDRVCDPNEEIEVYAWRKLHSSANLPSASRPRVVSRADCAVGSFRDDYKYSGLPQVSFIGRVKPPVHFAKAGNINNALYNEGASGRYCCIFDNDMQPHPKFILATLPFFFDDENNIGKSKFQCSSSGCIRVATICCASCKLAGVPEDRVSYCSKDCYETAMHVQSALHRRQVNGTISDFAAQKKALVGCSKCGVKVDEKVGTCKKCQELIDNNGDNDNNRSSIASSVMESNVNVDIATIHQYSDDVRDNSVAYVQTPQYFQDCVQLQIGDPCGHRNATFYDAIQTGMDGYECSSFAGTNAIFRRQALDSVGGIQYGSLTEDAYTGKKLTDLGWKALYFRKDFEGETSERIWLAAGRVPDSVAGALAQRKRWAKGNFQIFLRKSKDFIDPLWKRPEVPLPKYRHVNKLMKKIFYINGTLYPLGSFGAIFFYYITLYFLFTGLAPIYIAGLRLLFTLVPKLFIQGILSALSNRNVENNDVVRSQEAWFAYSWVNVLAVIEALWWKVTGKDTPWANTGSIGRGSWSELPNILVFFGAVAGILWSIVRFFAGYNTRQTSHGESILFASLLMGIFIAWKLGPMVRMSIQEYFGWSHRSLTDHGNFLGSSIIAFGLAFVCIWVYVDQPSSTPF